MVQEAHTPLQYTPLCSTKEDIFTSKDFFRKLKYLLGLPRELAVPVVDIFGLLLCQGVDTVAQGQEGPVDVSSLLQSEAGILQENNRILSQL